MQTPNIPTPAPAHPMMGNAPSYPANDDFLMQQLQQQIDFYFSPENLCRDNYLRSILYQNNGAVPVEVIASFPMIKKIVASAFLGPAAIYHTDPLTLPPADCNLIRHAVMLNSQTVMVEGMFFVHPQYRVQPHCTATAAFPDTTPQGRFAPVVDQDRRPSPVSYEQMKKTVSDDVSTRTLATVSPTSFASTLNPSADEEDDTKSYILVKGVPDDVREFTLKNWLAFDRRQIPEGMAPLFPLTFEKILADTWKLSFATESEARAAMGVISKRKFQKSELLVCQFVGGHSPTSMPITMLYQPYVLPPGEPVYYASAYPYTVLETAQKGMVALPYASPTGTTPTYTMAYSPTPVTPTVTPSNGKVSRGETTVGVQEDSSNISSPQEENISPQPSHSHQPTLDSRSRRKYHRGKNRNAQNKNRGKKKEELPHLVENTESSGEKKGRRAKAALDETVNKMAEMNLNKG